VSFKPIYQNIHDKNPEQAMDALLDLLPVSCFCFDEAGNLVASNKRFAVTLGISSKEEVVAGFVAGLPERQPSGRLTAELFASNAAKAKEEGESRFSFFWLKPDGERICLSVRLSAQEFGFTLGCAILAGEGHKGFSKADLKELEKFRQYFENTPIPCIVWNEEHVPIGCNKAMVQVFGMASEQELIESFDRLTPEVQPDGRVSYQRGAELMAKALEEGECKFAWTYRLKNGELVEFIVTMVSAELKDSRLLVAYIYDQRQINAEMQKVREANRMTQLFLDASPLYIAVWNDSFDLIECNQKALDFYGVSSVEEFKRRKTELLPEFQSNGERTAEHISQMLREALEEGQVKFEHWRKAASGQLVPIETTIVRLKLDSRTLLVGYSFDLRSIYAANARAKEADEMAAQLLKTLPMHIELWDQDLNIIDCNQQTLDFLGVSSVEECRERYFELAPEYQPCGTYSKQKVLDVLREAFREGHARFEFIHQSLSGQLMPIESTLVRIKKDGQPVVVVYSHDLRPIKAVIEHEREVEEINRALIEVMPMFTEYWDENMDLVDCSRQTWEMFGLDDKEDYLARHLEFEPEFQPDGMNSVEKANQIIEYLMSGQEKFVKTEWMHTDAYGNPLPVESFFCRIDVNGRSIVICFNQDLREIKNALAIVRETEERAKLLIEALPTACFLLNMNYNAIWCNHAALELFALEPGQSRFIPHFTMLTQGQCNGNCAGCSLYGRDTCTFRTYLIENFLDIFPGQKDDPEEISRFVASVCIQALMNGRHKFKFDHSTMYGELIPCEITIVPIKYQGQNAFACYLQDMREAQMMISETRRREIAEEENKEKTRFLAKMSHEIRTPMNAVLGITEAQLQMGGHKPETEEALLRIYSSSHLLLSIINDILDLSKVEAGKMEIVPATYETASMIVDTVQLNLMQIGSKNIEFMLNVDERLPAHMIGDELRIKQILNNLLSNAFKYTNDGMVRLSFSLEDSDQGHDQAILVIQVEDTGQGLTKEQARQIFDLEFTRFNLKDNRAIEGTGLGMHITNRLVNMMDGKVQIESALGEGSTFTVAIPQRIADSEVLGKELVTNMQNLDISTRFGGRKMRRFDFEVMPYGRVLVVDDVETNLYVAKSLLWPYKLAVETADSGPAAIAKVLAGESYDIIFMDHMMPEMDGVETTKALRDMGYDRPIVALTANTIKGVTELFDQSGFSGFVSKPINVEQLNAYLVRYVRGIQPAEVIEAAKKEAARQAVMERGNITEEMAGSFVRDAQKAIEVLEPILAHRVFDSDDLKAFIIQTHSMKSALINIGKVDLSDEAGLLEQAGRSASAQLIKARMPRFIAGLKEIVESLSYKEEERTLDDDPAFIRNQLENISIACESYDIDSANAALKALHGCGLSKGTAALLREVEACLLRGDFEDAGRLAKQTADR